MNKWFEVKVKYDTLDEQTGKHKRVTLPYLVDAISFTEAETRIHKEMEQYVSGEFSVEAIKKCNYQDVIFFDDGDKWYEVKTDFELVNEESGAVKKSGHTFLFLASSIKEANERAEESMKECTVDWEIKGVKDTPVRDVFPYFKNEEVSGNLKPMEQEAEQEDNPFIV